MAFVSATVGRLYVVRWQEPTEADVFRVEEEVAAFKRGIGKHAVHGLAIVPEATKPPDDRTRSAMSGSMSKLLDHLETMHTVIEGKGFKHSILRSAMTGIALLGGKRGRVLIHGTVGEAIDALAEQLGVAKQQLRSSLVEQGVAE